MLISADKKKKHGAEEGDRLHRYDKNREINQRVCLETKVKVIQHHKHTCDTPVWSRQHHSHVSVHEEHKGVCKVRNTDTFMK